VLEEEATEMLSVLATAPHILNHAIKTGNLSRVKALVTAGADVKARHGDMGRIIWGPLHYSAKYGQVATMEYLLEQGCDKEEIDSDGYSPLHLAAIRGRLQAVVLLMRWGAKIEAKTNLGELPLDLASANGHHAVANAIRAEVIRRRDRGSKRDRSTIEDTEEHEASKRPRVAVVEVESGDDDAVDDDDADAGDDDDAGV